MCSNTNALLIRVCLAIDELARRSASREGGASDGPGKPPDEITACVAAVWAMVADADPELARRLPGYLSVADPSAGDPSAADPSAAELTAAARARFA